MCSPWQCNVIVIICSLTPKQAQFLHENVTWKTLVDNNKIKYAKQQRITIIYNITIGPQNYKLKILIFLKLA